MEKYFVIKNSEDGELSFSVYNTKEELLKEIEAGDLPADFSEEGSFDGYDLANELNPHRPIVIRGKLVKTKPVERVTQYEVE